MRFRAFRDLGEGAVFGAIGVAALAAAAGTMASVPEVPPPAEVVEAAALPLPLLVDISSFVPPVEAPPEPEPEPVAEIPVAPPAPRTVARPVAPKPVRAEPPAPPKPSPPTKRKPKPCTVAPNPLIQATGPYAWTVRDGVVQQYTRDWSRLDELGWSEPHRGSDGRGDGMRIGGVRCGSDLWDAGIRSGDVIHSVNGRAVKSIPQALLVYAAIHGQDLFRVDITRHGDRKTLTYRLL